MKYVPIGGVFTEETDTTGAYYLIYNNDNEETRKNAILSMKNYFASKGEAIYSNPCLLFASEFLKEQSGSDSYLYDADTIETLYSLYKAAIATCSLDLRNEDMMYKKDGEYINGNVDKIVSTYQGKDGNTLYGYSKDNYVEDDYSLDKVYVTIRVQSVTYKSLTPETKNLTYKNKKDFQDLVNNNDEKALNYFTIDSSFNLIVAGQSTSSTQYSFDFSGATGLTDDEKNAIIAENVDETYDSNYKKQENNIFVCKKIPYQQYISKYALSFDFTSALYSGLQNEQFCKELAKLAETSTMIITLHEEHSSTTFKTTMEEHPKEKIYAVLDGTCSGTEEKATTSPSTNLLSSIENRSIDDLSSIISEYGGNINTAEKTKPYSEVTEYRWSCSSGTITKKYILGIAARKI